MKGGLLALAVVLTFGAAGMALTPAADPVTSGGARTESGFAVASTPRDFDFPRDHGPHPDFQHEWWYVTGNLDATTGERFGFELTFFRFALAPETRDERRSAREDSEAARAQTDGPKEAPAGMRAGSQGEESHWRTRQAYMAHFAITDVDGRRFHFSERYARGALGLAGARASPFKVWLESWSLDEPAGADTWKLHAADDEYALTLDLKSLLPPVPNGENGLIRKSRSSGAATYYYSIPRIAVRGRLSRGGKPFDVRGLAWLDREWGSRSLGLEGGGWDWFALQLGDGSALMFYMLRNRDGIRDVNSAGTWVASDGTVRRLTNDDVGIEVLDHWTSPRGGRYPSAWRLGVASLGLSLEVRPVLADQELNTSPRYWEGAVDVTGRSDDRDVRGRGYVELVGYASP